MDKIRNFAIFAHIDAGKSTLADRMLEITGTVEARKMQAQILDSMDLERERGITIKMAPVRMDYKGYILNLIDTPGHSDFGYEVSRALEAVEGGLLLVDATQGIQAQTLANFENAKRAGLKIIGAVNKVDVASPDQVDSAVLDLAELLDADPDEIIKTSGKTGDGIELLLEKLIQEVPAPGDRDFKISASRALIFDSQYDEHRGVIAFVRVFSGSFKLNGDYVFVATGAKFKAKDTGYFKPDFFTAEEIKNGEIGYIATGIKDPDMLKIGDTVSDVREGEDLLLPGYREVKPVVFVSFYPEDASDYDDFVKALGKLRLSDSALVFEPDKSEVLGRGFKGGFLGRLHFEITAERLEREFDINTISSFPSVAYRVRTRAGGDWLTINNPKDFPDDYVAVEEPVTKIEILVKPQYLGAILGLTDLYRLSEIETTNLGSERVKISAKLPLADLISDFDDKLKSVSAGFGSLSYEVVGYQAGELGKMEILVAENVIPGLTRILPKEDLYFEARRTVGKLKDLLPKIQFKQAIQAKTKGRIIARETIAALKKDVTGYLYGGDRTRKMKLWKKQQKGKKKLLERGTQGNIHIPAKVFQELLKK
ncbi:MAG: elongation factor 4 [Candidatus Harrisonbacteria bacterium CG10_big_fil_rev_8_21_14_0_10_44_23]|uniref:Elongation factor 4 n=1 Tax=Candidatus Harrisonbacteria bacterium CG10_big_fil_rev_8_21_14_0_10_44_23 TaxID=1974585 RepID=A0A2H0US28_9BACT|nr:MAG: elongation factor 4 [Candidatus Harrisonbacteria bacterium CG10_big_fil_rev_8_21_14_0_10_44_23]